MKYSLRGNDIIRYKEIELKILDATPQLVRFAIIEDFTSRNAEISSGGRIGIFLDKNRVVVSVTPNSPAGIAGIKVGDQVTSANGVALTGNLEHDAALIRGEPRSKVILRIIGEQQEFEAEVVRAGP